MVCNKTAHDDALEKAFNEVALTAGGKVYPLDVDQIQPNQAVRLKCQVPLCEYYDVCKVCPPNIPSVSEFKEALQSYSRAYLIVLTEKIEALEVYREDFSAELKLADMVSSLERTAFEHGYYQALGLCVGGCKLCTQCALPGEACRHPFKARPSPEGFGIDITQLARQTGVPVEWPPRHYVNFMGLLLV